MKILIRIWLNNTYKEAGHVSLETEPFDQGGIYASFWPPLMDDSDYETDAYTVKKLDYGYLRTESYDKIQLSRPPTKTIVLNNLDIGRVHVAFKQFMEGSNRAWSSFGSVLGLEKLSPETKNCVGLTLHLLGAGGMANAFSSYSNILSRKANEGLWGMRINRSLGRSALSVFRIGCVYFLGGLYYYGICERNAESSKEIAVLPIVRNTSLVSFVTTCITLASSYLDSDKKQTPKWSAALQGAITGGIFGYAIFSSIHYLAENYALAPGPNRFFNALGGLVTFYFGLSLFGERSFLTRWAARSFGFFGDTVDEKGLVITPRGLLKLLSHLETEIPVESWQEDFVPTFQ